MRIGVRSAFTLAELLLVVAIVGITAGFAVPTFFTAVQQSRANEAIANLNVIYAAERVYFLNNGTFWPSSGSPQSTAANLSAINAALNLDLAPPQFYPINITGGAATFTAIALTNRPGGTRSYQVTQSNPNPTTSGDF